MDVYCFCNKKKIRANWKCRIRHPYSWQPLRSSCRWRGQGEQGQPRACHTVPWEEKAEVGLQGIIILAPF